MPMFSVKWNLADIKQDKPVKVFSTFACGGGSTMGYKRAGFEVIGNCEIDPAMNKVYVANNKPKYNYNMDVRDFLKQELPEELYNIDILDGSPPCSSFSLAGLREETWGKEKAFRFAGTFLTVMAVLTAVLSAVGMGFAGPLVELFADGYDADTAQLAVRLTQIMFPTVLFTGVAFSFVVPILCAVNERTLTWRRM